MFGDVWVCSGQSNMEWRMSGILNADEEVAKSAEYPNIKLFRTNHMTASDPQNDLQTDPLIVWEPTSNANAVRQFSAVCLLTARYMADALGKDKVFGLIESNWGGTRIEAWSPKEGLDNCNVEPNEDENNPSRSNSYLYNAMIHPLVRTSIYGALWYQGEANAGWNRDLYGCTFSQMIEQWRKIWAEHSGSNPSFPFGFMQLAQVKADTKVVNPSYPMIRWYQTCEQGYVPNDLLKV